VVASFGRTCRTPVPAILHLSREVLLFQKRKTLYVKSQNAERKKQGE
jgi:hypothetical protein